MTDEPEPDLPPRRSQPSDFRLPRVLAKRLKVEGGHAALARAISLCWREDPASRFEEAEADAKPKAENVIDRRKLKRLIQNDSEVTLSVKELRVLDSYLDRYGEGLAFRPLFEKPDIMRTLATSGHVTFLLTSKVDEEGGTFSHWDVLAMAEFQRRITTASDVSVQLDIQNVPFYSDPRDPKRAIEPSWRVLFDDPGPSLITLASSRTNPAAEVMQSLMFGLRPFEPAPPQGGVELPLHFVWNPKLDSVFPSHFHRAATQIEALDPGAASLVKSGKASAIEFGGAIYTDQARVRNEGETYGVCFAQRRRHGQVWLLLAGLTGAGTYAAAKMAKRIRLSLREERPSDVHCFLIRAYLEPSQKPTSLGRVRDSTVEVVGRVGWQGASAARNPDSETAGMEL